MDFQSGFVLLVTCIDGGIAAEENWIRENHFSRDNKIQHYGTRPGQTRPVLEGVESRTI
jgi:hypothetical protein